MSSHLLSSPVYCAMAKAMKYRDVRAALLASALNLVPVVGLYGLATWATRRESQATLPASAVAEQLVE